MGVPLGHLVLAIARQGSELSGVWPRDRARLLACAQDFLLRNHPIQ